MRFGRSLPASSLERLASVAVRLPFVAAIVGRPESIHAGFYQPTADSTVGARPQAMPLAEYAAVCYPAHADWGELAHDDRDVPCGLIHVTSAEALQRT